jgi:hypothetical protein
VTTNVGRAPSGRALAVPATPLRVDGPSGFDPSRLDAYARGKLAFLRGQPFSPPSSSTEGVCDWRSGWLVAECNRRSHPEWGEQWILCPDIIKAGMSGRDCGL